MRLDNFAKTRMPAIFTLTCYVVLIIFGLPTSLEAARKAPWQSWKSEINKDHALAGRIWSAKKGDYLTPLELSERLAINDFVLIGEVHDNPDHHRLQAWLIKQIVRYDRKPAIVMEMINQDQAPALAAYINGYDAPAANLGNALRWAESGWPKWSLYQPIANMAFAFRLPMAAGSASKKVVKSVGKNGYGALESDLPRQLGLNLPLAPPLVKKLREDLKVSHCNLLPDKALGSMSKVQRFRDAVMTDQLLKAGAQIGAVLIAGNGHVRVDRGVPWYIKRRTSNATIAAIMLMEIDEQAVNPKDIIPLDPWGKPAADYIWFTPKTKREDQCEKLKKMFGKKKH